jgi:cell division septation protein DedD
MTEKMFEDIICGLIVLVAIAGTLLPIVFSIRKENKKKKTHKGNFGGKK